MVVRINGNNRGRQNGFQFGIHRFLRLVKVKQVGASSKVARYQYDTQQYSQYNPVTGQLKK